MADIDLVWDSLKNEEGVPPCSLPAATFGKKNDPPKSGKTKLLTKQTFAVETFDIDAITADDLRAKSSSYDDTRDTSEAADSCLILVSGLETNDTAAAVLCDSDDEEDLDEVASPQHRQSSNTPSFRIERIAKALCSDDLQNRLHALHQLKEITNALMLHCSEAPKLNLPPPFDDSHIKLNQNLPLVSDLVKPKQLGRLSATAKPDQEKVCISSNGNLKETRAKLQAVLNSCGNSLFRLIGDNKSEKCRVLSVECLQPLLLSGAEFGRHIPYLIPALCARYPSCTYDKNLEVFVQDSSLHEFYLRGGATDRQDRDRLVSQVIEPSENLRLSLCQTFNCLLRGVLAMGAERTLDAYYAEIIFALHSNLSDPFPDLKIEASHLLVQLLRIPHWEQGAKYFATGLARSALPNCRHRKTNVIIAAMDLLEASVCVPDKAKVKGAGTAAVADLVGFQEENVLPIAAFYDSKCSVSVNTLAELASHKNHRVRLRCCEMLSYFLVYLPDRYDHQQRLLPYILSFINDEMSEVQETALKCIEKCGLQYQCEHPDYVIERRQFGVDGDEDIDYNSNLPAPFTQRPSLGARLFVRANTSRFFLALLGELSNWRDETRKRSAELLLILTVYLEEHLTKDLQHTINSISKSISVEKGARHDNDHLKIVEKIQQVLRLTAKYVNPSVYLPLICPRISGSTSSTSNSEDGYYSEKSRASYTIILSSLIEGAPLQKLLPHWLTLTSLLSENCGTFVGTQTRHESMAAFTLMNKVDVKRLTSHFENTGELDKLRAVLSSSGELLSASLDSLEDSTDDINECIKRVSTILDAISE